MRRLFVTLVLCALFAAAGAGTMAYLFWMRRPPLPDTPALVVQMRDVARLETLDVALYKKVPFRPDPDIPSDSMLRNALAFLKETAFPKEGKAIVFADVHLGLDFSKLTADSVRVHGDAVDVALPPIHATVELKPGETEVIDSNLDSQQTAQLLQAAKDSFERETMADRRLQERARESAQRAIKGFLLSVGFRQVNFVETLPKVEPG
ncbi:MAG TPA: DUF4230 domain-containing protein [Myxococcaceae bacterium]|nr:DUF4230 domain-containing protein [Myxococcaceae bacterium]